MPQPLMQTNNQNQTGDHQLFWKLLQPEHARAEAFCRRLVGNREDGDDLYQDCLLNAMRKFHTLKELGAFRPWLYRIFVNRYKNRFRPPGGKNASRSPSRSSKSTAARIRPPFTRPEGG